MSWVIVEQNSPLNHLVMCHTRSVTGLMPTTQKETSYSCSGGCKILSCGFIHNNPWVIPISIEGISLNNINNLPLTINVYHRRYKLGGCTMNTGGYFVAILLWHGAPYFYDGIRSTKQQRFIEYNPGLLANLVNCTDSYPYYFLSSCNT